LQRHGHRLHQVRQDSQSGQAGRIDAEGFHDRKISARRFTAETLEVVTIRPLLPASTKDVPENGPRLFQSVEQPSFR